VIGSGAREHALVRSLSADPAVTDLHAAPGNPGIAATAQCHPVVATDPEAVAGLARELAADLVVIGPEAPLVAGVADAVRAAGIACFGPSRVAAQLEGSKAFAKAVMAAGSVPTAAARLCSTVDEAAAALDEFGPPYVVKDDGLAAGKGVVVTDDHALALAHAQACDSVVIEEYLDGPEVSLFVATDGVDARPLVPAQDFKRVGDGDTGPNTGGMGAYAPLPWLPDGFVDEVMSTVVTPTLREMADRGTPFAGLLYVGLALTAKGPMVVEFNARFGDPETAVILPLLETPLAGLLLAAATGRLTEHPPLRWRDAAAVAVVLASAGYPSAARSGDVIHGQAELDGILHAGTIRGEDGVLRSSGGRILCCTGVGSDLHEARARAYELLSLTTVDGSHYRHDIALAAGLGQRSPAIGGLQ
jgi:phosphoribosylamine--glycine ligase